MSTNPFHNAVLAIGYILGLVSSIFLASTYLDTLEESIFMPVAMLSMLVLSVAVMAYLFFYQPIVLLLDGKREQAVKLFLQTIGIFAGAIVLLIAASYFVSSF